MRSPLARLRWILAPAMTVALVALGVGPAAAAPTAKKLKAVTLNGSGATFPQAFYEEAIAAFKKEQPDVTINYGAGGSGKGRTDFAGGVTDFGASDAPYTSGAPTKPFLYFPTVVAPITVSYNLPSVSKLQLSGPTISKIFQRQIKSWNDPAIAAENPSVNLPNTAITVARRSDGSGTTENFLKFLTQSDPTGWKLGAGSTASWPSDTQGGSGNAGVSAIVKGTEGAIGYVDLSDARASGLKFASIKNLAGKYVAPTVKGASAAAGTTAPEANLLYNPIFAPGEKSYPITAPTWLLVSTSQSDSAKGAAIQAFLNFIYTKGQKLAPSIDYAPLAGDLASRAKAQVKQLQGV